MIEKTLSIIKPDAYNKKIIGKVITKLEDNNIDIIAIKMLKLTKQKAEEFYAVHKEKPFFPKLIEFMLSGPIVVMVLKGENIIQKYRSLMGNTDYTKALPGTIRAEFASTITVNTVHGSDAPETAEQEINFFFSPEDLIE